MSAEEPTTTPEERIAAVSHVKTWDELEGRTGGTAIEEEKSAPSQGESKGNDGNGRKRVLSRRVRFVGAGVFAVLVVALASIIVAALVGRDSVPRSQPRSGAVHAKGRRAERRRASRARWFKEADGSPRPRQRRTAHGAARAGRHVHRRRRTPRPARQPAEAPTQSPESAAALPAPPPEPSAPAPPAPSAPKEGPGLRDGATESSEFGL